MYITDNVKNRVFYKMPGQYIECPMQGVNVGITTLGRGILYNDLNLAGNMKHAIFYVKIAINTRLFYRFKV